MTKTIRLKRPADPFSAQIAARLEAKRSRAGMPARAETQPVANVVPMRPCQMLMVCVAKINELIGRA